MSQFKYFYDVSVRKNNKSKKVKTQITGEELKRFQNGLKNIIDQTEITVYKTTIDSKGKSKRTQHAHMFFGLNSIINDIFGDNFHYSVDVEYDTYRDCDTSCDPYCRCSKITNARVENININNMVNYFIDKIVSKTSIFKTEITQPIFKYCLDRILRCSVISDPEAYEIFVDSGYYGEEINSVRLNHTEQLIKNIFLLFNKSDVDAIKFVLEEEYGYLLEKIKNIGSCKIEKVNISNLEIPNREHYIKLDKKIILDYENHEYPIGIYIYKNGKYSLIDGYHRLCANKDKKQVEIIVLS